MSTTVRFVDNNMHVNHIDHTLRELQVLAAAQHKAGSDRTYRIYCRDAYVGRIILPTDRKTGEPLVRPSQPLVEGNPCRYCC